jgi:curved DNA-binding protein CbpA
MTTFPSGNPWAVLGLTADASTAEVRARYVELVKLHPPDRDPDAFERIRDAYRAASDPLARARERLFGPSPVADLDELDRCIADLGRKPAGAAAWLSVFDDRA